MITDVGAASAPTYVFGDYRLIAATLRLERAGTPVAMTPRVFSTLLYLVENGGRTVGKDELLGALWPGRIADEANLSQAISAVRRALGSDADAARLIVTVPGRGYRFTAPVALEASSRGSADEASPVRIDAPAPSIRRLRRSSRWIPLAAAIGVFGLVGSGVAWRLRAPHATSAAHSRIVLADLQNFTGERAFDHVITRMMQVDLAQSPFLQLTAAPQVAETLGLMEAPRDAPLTPALALSVCARSNGAVVIAPAIAKLGGRFLLTLIASDCVDGKPLFDDKAEVADENAIPRAVDDLSARLRRRLGEVGASIAHFDIPLAPERTRSFPALRAYSEAEWLTAQGRTLEAIPLYRHAVALDPDFAMAWLGLSQACYETHQPREDAAAIVHAYRLRATASEPNALRIDTAYNTRVTRDFQAALQSLAMMTRLYPDEVASWSNLSDLQFRLGDFAAAIGSGERALRLDPRRTDTYSLLVRPLVRIDRLARAEALDMAALHVGPQSGQILQQRIALRFLQGDEAGSERLIAGAVGTPLEREALLEGYNLAVAAGRMRHAAELIARAGALGRPEASLPFLAEEAANDAIVGLADEGRATLRRVPASLWTGEYDVYAAELADPAVAEADLARDLVRWPHDTLLEGKFAPEARATLLLRRGRPREAVRALDAVGGFMFMDLDAPFMRATALLAARDGPGAAAAFRAVLTHVGLGWDAQFRLARLGLARALRLEGDLRGSRREYTRFLSVWHDADPDLPPVRQAQAELAALTAPTY